jgi:hypothetical protein
MKESLRIKNQPISEELNEATDRLAEILYEQIIGNKDE